MERLTRRSENGIAIYNTPSGDPVKWENNRKKVLQKLAEYEDLEEQCIQENSWGLRMLLEKWKEFYEDIQQLYEYRKLEEQGKLLKLPCAVGDTVYYLDRFCSGCSLDCPSRPCESCEDYQLEIYEGKFKSNDIDDFGKTVFLTRQEAAAKLAEMEGRKNGEVDE